MGMLSRKNRIVKQLGPLLWILINSQETLNYWAQQKQYTQDQLQAVDWSLLAWAMRSIPLSKCRWASKQMSGHFMHRKTWFGGNSKAQLHVPVWTHSGR